MTSGGRPQVEQRSISPSMIDDKSLQRGFKIAIWATALSFTSLTVLSASFLRSKNTISYHKQFLLVFSLISMCISFACGVLMVILWALCRGFPYMTPVFKILVLGSIVWATLGVLFAAAFCIQRTF